MKSYRIHLIRNMPCEGNLQGRYIGRTESPLADSSVTELLQMKRKFNYPKATGYYAAPASRCVDTLRLIYPWADPKVILELAECDFGDWENKTADELKNDPAFAAWVQNSGNAAPPNGESGVVVAQRVCMGFEMLVQNLMVKGETDAVLVLGAGALTTILAAYGLPQAKPYDWMCAPGCGYTVRITPSLWMRSRVMEVIETMPHSDDNEQPDHLVIDIAREAADRAFSQDDDTEEPEHGTRAGDSHPGNI